MIQLIFSVNMYNRSSFFDSFFSPTTIVVVSEERLKKAEIEAKQAQLEAVKARHKEIEAYEKELEKELDALTEPQSLEEALTGE